MSKDEEFVYCTIDGKEVSKDDPDVQTRYTREDYKALDKAAMFDGAKARIERDQQITDGVPVDGTVVEAKSTHSPGAVVDHETADEAAHARASVAHAKK